MKRILFVLLSVICLKANAQDLTIVYDFIKDQFTYEQNGKPINQPVIKKNYEVRVLVKNLNPFVFIARCNWKEVVQEESSSVSGMASMIPGFNLGGNAIGMLLGSVDGGQFDVTKINRGGPSMLQDDPIAQTNLDDIITSYNKLFELEQTLTKIDFTSSKLKKIKYNPYLPADTLKKIAEMLLKNSIAEKNKPMPNIYSATTFITLSSTLSNTLKEQFIALRTSGENFLLSYEKYNNQFGNNFKEAGMNKSVINMVTAAVELNKKYSSDNIHEKVDYLEQQFESINYTPFSYTCNYKATSDLLSLDLDFFEISPYTRLNETLLTPGGDMVDTLRKIRTKKINVTVKGDMKINTSVGLGFPTYLDANKTFSNSDSFIRSTPGNNFTPCISTYVNFYPYSGKNLHIGGTFGIGIPVQTEGASALNFFLGGSAILGSSSKVVLHAGLSIGQLNVLSKGQKEGDKLKDQFTEPTTRKAFKTGGFFGISFALSK